jgi:FlaG/FlaF family flagellin (archaellin)
MRKFGEGEEAVSQVIGAVLMVGLTVIMVSAIAVSVYGFSIPESAPQAKIVVREVRGNDNTLMGNEIVLFHKGGDTLYPDKIKIVIHGEGKEALKGESITGVSLGKIVITYNNLEGYNYVNYSGRRKDRHFFNLSSGNDTKKEFGKIIEGDSWSTGALHGDSWSAGRKVVLYGADGRVEANENTVDKKWELNPGSRVTITLIDIPTSQTIAVTSATVKESSQVVGT